MKKILFAMILSAMTSTSHAAKISSCIDAIKTSCGSLNALAARINLAYLDNNAECKWIQQNANTVTFFDNEDMISTDLNTCSVNKAQAYGRLVDEASFAGRLFLVTSRNRVLMVGRNACIYEMLTSKGEHYKAVTGVSVDNGVLSLLGTTAKFDDEAIQKRIQKGNGLDVISCDNH